jgi:hypothetical protein
MDANIETAAYAIGGFILPGVVSSTVLGGGATPQTGAQLRQKLGIIGITSVIGGVLAVMGSTDHNTKAAGAGIAISGALLGLAALKIPQTSTPAQVAGGVLDPLLAAMHHAATAIPGQK